MKIMHSLTSKNSKSKETIQGLEKVFLIKTKKIRGLIKPTFLTNRLKQDTIIFLIMSRNKLHNMSRGKFNN